MEPTEYKAHKFSKSAVQHCWMCGCDLVYETATVDHLRPKGKGGRNKKENFRLACKPCNQARGARKLTKAEWGKALGRQKPKQNAFEDLAKAIRANFGGING